MQHLTMEDLARLVDEAPGREEAEHLEGCPECRAELEEMRSQTDALAALPRLAAPRRAWPLLERRLRAEGLVAVRSVGRGWGSAAVRVAASVALFAAGGVVGAAVWGGGAGTVAANVASAPVRTAAEAEAAVRSTEEAYLDALTRYAELSGSAEADPVNRLAALEGIVLTTRAALEEAPADPVINGYHLTALSQREAILRSIGRTSESGDEWF